MTIQDAGNAQRERDMWTVVAAHLTNQQIADWLTGEDCFATACARRSLSAGPNTRAAPPQAR